MKALITGINGQDGSYLAELLLSKGYEVHGIVRRNSIAANQSIRINHIYDKLELHYGDMTDFSSLFSVISKVRPDEIYNLAAQSHVKVSEETPIYTAQADAVGVVNLLEIVRQFPCRLYQASTSEMFGNHEGVYKHIQNERTPFKPVSPYGASKLFAHNLCTHYRTAYGLKISCGILFNHTSPRRGDTFVEKKIVNGFKEYKKTGKRLELGNLSAKRDIGYSPEYVEAMWMMLQNEPDDYVIGTGETYSVEEICKIAAKELDITNIFDVVTPSEKYMRANELNYLCADPTKAMMKLGWNPKKKLPEIIKEMIHADG